MYMHGTIKKKLQLHIYMDSNYILSLSLSLSLLFFYFNFVEVQKITMLYQGPKQRKGLKSRKVKHLGFQ